MRNDIVWNGETCRIAEDEGTKIARSPNYKFNFSKSNGLFVRWGRTPKDDPEYSPFGPEIADIELCTDGCPNKCPFCSPAGTIVNTPAGNRPIEEIKVGDEVLGYGDGVIQKQKVIETYAREYEGEMVYIEMENGQTVALTPEHPVMLAGGEQVPAGHLSGDEEIICLG